MQNPFQQAGHASAESQDPLAFVKKLWGDMQLPGMVTPNLSLDDLDKQIQDLKTVESWLALNMNMLRGSIQALEVQRATIAALKTMGESFTKTANGSEAPPSHASWPMTSQAKASNAAAFDSASDPLLAENEEVEEDDPSGAASTASDASPPPVNPAAWWTVLQDQFKQALQTALQEHGAEPVPASSKPATAPKAKKSTKASASTTTVKKSSKTVKTKAKVIPAAAARAKPSTRAKSK